MSNAKPIDWKTETLPSQRATILVDRTFSQEEMVRIRRGLVPEQMEDKWFIYWENNALFFHRSWTGFCIYIVQFADEGNGWKMVEACVNRDPEQYTETSDEQDSEMISYLVDVLLLHRDTAFPSNEPSSEKSALMNWSQAGRAMLGQHPNDEGTAQRDAPADVRLKMKHCEQSIRSLYESEKTEARDRLASLSVAGGRLPTVSGLNGWIYEQTIRSCIECELQGHHPNLKIEEQVQFLKRTKLDLVIGPVAIEVKSAGLFGQADADKYRRYRKAVESSGKHFLYITSYETYIPYRELTVEIFGEDCAFFLDSSGTWERFVKTILGLLTEAESGRSRD